MIELGELAPGEVEQELVDRPRPRRREFIASAIALICLLVFAGQVPQTRMELIGQIEVRGTAVFRVIGEDLVVSDASGLALFRAGRQVWRVAGRSADLNTLDVYKGLILQGFVDGPDAFTVAVDRHTGAVVWRMESMAEFYGDFAVAFGPSSEDLGYASLLVYSAETGALLWTVQPTSEEAYAVDLARNILGRVDLTGSFTEHDLDTGRVLRAKALPVHGLNVRLNYVGDEMWVSWSHETGQSDLWFDSQSLNKTVESPRRGYDCGTAWCRDAMEALGVELVDKQTGQRRFQRQWITALPTSNGILALAIDEKRRWLEVLDPATGQIASAPDRWTPLADRSVGEDEPEIRRTDTLLIVPGEGQLHLGELRPDGMHVLGTLPHLLVTTYQADGRYLAYRVGRHIWWWQLG